MPNRILKESITTSDTIDALSAEEERFFCRLLVVADDFGRADARAAVLRAKCFPLKVDLSLDAVEEWLSAICRAGLARTYHVDGRRYLEIVTWREHQNVRAKASKFPDPATFDDDPATPASGLIASASKCDQASSACEQPQANVPVLVSRSSYLEARESDLDPAAAVADGPRADAADTAAKATPPAKPDPVEAQITEVLEHWRDRVWVPTDGDPKVNIEGPKSEGRRKLIRPLLREGWTVERLKRVVDGAASDDWLMGRSPGAKPGGWTEVENVFRRKRLDAREKAATAPAPARRKDNGPPPPGAFDALWGDPAGTEGVHP